MSVKLKNFFKMSSNLRLGSLIEFYKLKYLKKDDNSFHNLKLKNGLNITVRKSAGDLTTLFEVFIDEDYKFGEDSARKINILDIGANVGYFSLYVSRKFPEAKVFAFEPFPDTFKRLSSHLKMNSTGNVTPLNYAVSDFNGTSKFYSFEWSGCNTLVDGNYDENTHETTTVNCISFDSLFKFTGADEFEFAKVDCEGSEYAIFLNSSDESIKRINKYIIEVHNSEKFSVDDLKKKFESLGFKTEDQGNLLISQKK